MNGNQSHFEGKNVFEHLKAARMKGKIACREEHVTEGPTLLSLFLDGFREITYLFSLLALSAFFPFWPLAPAFFLAWSFFRTGRVALIAWSRLARMRRVIEDEKFEIEHHRDEEKEELSQIYAMKGLQEPLLGQVIETLMADDNRLLQVMLEEELGIQLEKIDHPLKQALFLFLGTLASFLLLSIAFIIGKTPLLLSFAAFFIGLSAFWLARKEKIDSIRFVIWHLSLFGLTLGTLHFMIEIIQGFIS